MRRSFCGSHRERVEAAGAIQASRRRRRISLELDEFERPGGRALFEESPEVEAYLAALSVNPSRTRRASIDCPKSAHHLGPFVEEGQKDVTDAMEEDRSPLSDPGSGETSKPQVETQPGPVLQCAPTNGTRESGSKNIFASARRACASFVRKRVVRGGPRGGSSTTENKAQGRSAAPSSGTPSTCSKEASPAGAVIAPLPKDGVDTWAGDTQLKEWVDWSVVDSALGPPDLLQAQQALIAGSRGAGYLLPAASGLSKN